MTSKNKVLLLVIFLVLIVAGAGIYLSLFYKSKPSQPDVVYCTQDAKMCPDGSYVGRSGPKCEFAPCPETSIDKDWKYATDTSIGVSFRYPEKLPTEFISTVDWPPKVQILSQEFECTVAGDELSRAGKTELIAVGGHQYCRTKETEGAAGSIYTNYAYAFPKNNGTAILTFSLRFVQCGNYDEPQKTACENERTNFNMDPTINKIASTLVIDKNLISNLFDKSTAKAGDKIGEMTIKSIDDRYTKFTGQITVSGQVNVYGEDDGGANILSDNVCMNVDQADWAKFPRIKGDERNIWFCFSNLDPAKKAFKQSGQATVVIDDYVIDSLESEVWNQAKLVKVTQ
ncbi:MAG: hypothetical protein PHC70_04110 [Patescibacteria group bacterium]|nr:hypothetical protein [Patescibacteria group bacterium]